MSEATKAPNKVYNYRPQYGVVVICKDEKDQERVFNKLKKDGLKLKVVAV